MGPEWGHLLQLDLVSYPIATLSSTSSARLSFAMIDAPA